MKISDSPYTILVALDLDGTSVRYDPRLEMDPVVIDYLRTLRGQGVGWVMNSDRYTDDMIDIAGFLEPDDQPEAILSCQRFIFMSNGNGEYLPSSSWNKNRMQLHKELWDAVTPYFPEWRRQIEDRFTILNTVVNDLVFAYLVSPDQTFELRELMQSFIRPWPAAQISGNHEWSFILHADFSKGSVLRHCAEKLGIDTGRVICVGDGINDITMLNGSVSPHVGCPANASSDVKETVQSVGGFVAGDRDGAGTIQVIRHYVERLG